MKYLFLSIICIALLSIMIDVNRINQTLAIDALVRISATYPDSTLQTKADSLLTERLNKL